MKVQIAKASDVAKEINGFGGSAIAIAGDLLNDQYIVDLVKKAAEFGNGKIHIIVNNAGFTWDGVIHKVQYPHPLLPLNNYLTHCRLLTNNGTLSSPFTAAHRSSSSAPQHPTSVSKTANPAT